MFVQCKDASSWGQSLPMEEQPDFAWTARSASQSAKESIQRQPRASALEKDGWNVIAFVSTTANKALIILASYVSWIRR